MTHTTTESTADTTRTELNETAQKLVELGGAWARYGLTIGRLAIENSARSLDVAARALGALADVVDPKTAAAADDKPTIVSQGE